MLPLGRLVGPRGSIAHGRVEIPELLKQGYYDTEAIARSLIRADAGISAGWPAMPTATAFPLPLGRRISEAQGRWDEEWHADGLPRPDDEPAAAGLPRLDAVLGEHSEWLKIDEAEDDDTKRRLSFWASPTDRGDARCRRRADRESRIDYRGLGRKAMLATPTFSSLRLGELTALERDDLDLAGGWITVQRSKTDAGKRKTRSYDPFCATSWPSAGRRCPRPGVRAWSSARPLGSHTRRATCGA